MLCPSSPVPRACGRQEPATSHASTSTASITSSTSSGLQQKKWVCPDGTSVCSLVEASDQRVDLADRSSNRCEAGVLVWEGLGIGWIIGDPEGDTGIYVLALCLLCLLEAVVENGLRNGLGTDGEVCDDCSR